MLNSSAGLVFQKSFFKWDINAVYDFLPFTMNKKASEQIFYGINNFIFSINRTKFSFPTRVGKKRFFEIYFNSAGNEILKLKTLTEISQGIQCGFFIADLGFFRSTANFSFFTDWIPESKFLDYRIKFNLPATFNLYYVDLAFMYSLYHTGKIKQKHIAPLTDYEIGKTQTSITGRPSFKQNTKYYSMHIFGSEIRWYVFRKGFNSNGFFISAFADTGLGITKEKEVKLIAEYGLGAGCTLFDNVPFTFQAGLNQSLQPVFYLGIVSQIIQNP